MVKDRLRWYRDRIIDVAHGQFWFYKYELPVRKQLAKLDLLRKEIEESDISKNAKKQLYNVIIKQRSKILRPEYAKSA
jgi:hypothetical protein